jgi:tripartite-type tricarboxylate transporter receptor subunit TctC
MAEVARAQPDGYTMMITGSSYCIVSLLMPNLPFRMGDFAPLTRLTAGPTVLVVPSTLGVRTLAEFIAAAKARPGAWSYGSVGVGTSLHLGGEMLKMRAGIDLVHVPYHGWPNASTDLIAGRTQMYFATVSDALPLIVSGRLRALAVSHTERLQALPDVPVFAEVGFPGLRCTTDFGMSIGAGVPAPIRMKLEEAFRTAIRRPEIRERLLSNGAFVVGSTAEEAASVIAEDTARYAEVIRAANIRLE